MATLAETNDDVSGLSGLKRKKQGKLISNNFDFLVLITEEPENYNLVCSRKSEILQHESSENVTSTEETDIVDNQPQISKGP